MTTYKFPQGDHNLLKVNSPVLKVITHQQNIQGTSNNNHTSYEMKIDQSMSKPHHHHSSFNQFKSFLCGFLS